MQSANIFTNDDWLKASFLFQKAHFRTNECNSNLIFTQNLKFIYADASAAFAEFLMSV